jgi:hypothetical protein
MNRGAECAYPAPIRIDFGVTSVFIRRRFLKFRGDRLPAWKSAKRQVS